MYEPYRRHLCVLQDKEKYRRLPEIGQANQASRLDFSSNDYLNLIRHPALLQAGIAAAKQYGVGATGSRLLSGNNELFKRFEAQIAQDKKTDAALIFNTGFQANISVLSALLDANVLGDRPLVFFDKCNHSSLYQAVFLSDAVLVRYPHNNLQQLEILLQKYHSDRRPKFIVTETLFGMDGDILPLQEIVLLAKKHGAFLYLDEAHAVGVLGPSGYGLSTTVAFTDVHYVVVGTFSKALGCSGGYVACNQILRDYLINKATGFIYSTAPSPFVIGAAYKAWELVRTLHDERKQLRALSEKLKIKLLDAGLNIGQTNTHILPIIFKQERLVMQLKEELLNSGVVVSAIRPPTVPPNSSRLRVSLTSAHREKDIDRLLTILSKRS